MRFLVFLSVLLLSFNAAAIDCGKAPSCAELGFTQADDPACAADGYMFCPFDHSYKKCVNYSCEALGYTQSDKSAWCGKVIKCRADESYTLCQSSCQADDAATLTEFAGSGDCSTVYMLKDITLPADAVLNVADGTAIEGNKHTLTLLNPDRNIFTFGRTGLNNLTIMKAAAKMNGSVITNQGNLSIENLTITGDFPLDTTWWSAYAIGNSGSSTLNITGNLYFNIPNFRYITGGSVYVKNAELDKDGSFLFDTSTIIVEDSTITSSSRILRLTMTMYRSSWIGTETYAFWTNVDSKNYSRVELKDGSRLDFPKLTGVNADGMPVTIILNGSAVNPVWINLPTLNKLENVTIVSNLPTDTLVLNKVTYHPLRAAETPLADIPTSPNWRKE